MKLYFEDYTLSNSLKIQTKDFLFSVWSKNKNKFIADYKKSNEKSLSDYVYKHKDLLEQETMKLIDSAHREIRYTRPPFIGSKEGKEWTAEQKEAAKEFLLNLTQTDYNRILYLKRDDK